MPRDSRGQRAGGREGQLHGQGAVLGAGGAENPAWGRDPRLLMTCSQSGCWEDSSPPPAVVILLPPPHPVKVTLGGGGARAVVRTGGQHCVLRSQQKTLRLREWVRKKGWSAVWGDAELGVKKGERDQGLYQGDFGAGRWGQQPAGTCPASARCGLEVPRRLPVKCSLAWDIGALVSGVPALTTSRENLKA